MLPKAPKSCIYSRNLEIKTGLERRVLGILCVWSMPAIYVM